MSIPFVGQLDCVGTHSRPTDAALGHTVERAEDQWVVALHLKLTVDAQWQTNVMDPLKHFIEAEVRRNQWWPINPRPEDDPVVWGQNSAEFYVSVQKFQGITEERIFEDLARKLKELGYSVALAAGDPEAQAEKRSRDHAEADMHFSIVTN